MNAHIPTEPGDEAASASVPDSGLSLEGVTVQYPGVDHAALENVTLRVPRGQIVALLGPSGCGKSTLLRAVGGLEPLRAGRVCWDGEDLRRVAPHRRGFGLVFQDGQLFVHRSVAENIAYGLRVQRVPARDRAARVRSLLALIGLEGYEDRAVSALSGGERQRVALARSLAPRPRLLMLDEPLSALDQGLRERLATEMRGLLRDTTALWVTHDPREATTVADRIVRMSRGSIASDERVAR